MHIRVDDIVEVLSGNDAGTRARVLRILGPEHRAVVEGVNNVYKHIRRSQRNPQGGRLSKEMPVHMSSIMLVCAACNQASRTGSRFLDDGSKERYCKKCGASGGQIAPPRPAYAKKP